MSLFTSVYQTENVTPYLHVLVSHMPEFLKLYGSISPFSQQGLEKLNDNITKSYFRSTNHRDISSLHQLLLKLNHIEEVTFNPDCIHSKEFSYVEYVNSLITTIEHVPKTMIVLDCTYNIICFILSLVQL